MISERVIFNSKELFEVKDVEAKAGALTVNVVSKQKSCRCPLCRRKSERVHSYYYRKVNDLAAFENKITLRLKARKFYCSNIHCTARVFTERFSVHLRRYQRNTERLDQKLLKIAVLIGGNSGSRLCSTLNIAASSSTLIRQIHRQIIAAPEVSDTIGIDDWAFRKGISYGTAVVDLKKKKIIDLLPDRNAETVERWLSKRPDIKIVTRDRYSQYAKAISNQLPEAKPVADRWHLIKNLGDALEKVLIKVRQELRQENKNVTAKQYDLIKSTPSIVLPDQQSDAPRDTLLQQIKTLHKKGVSIRQIAVSLHTTRVTIRKYLRLHKALVKNEGKTNIHKFYDHLQRRIKETLAIETIQLWKEISAMGYTGSRSTFYHHLKDRTASSTKSTKPFLKNVSWLPSKVSILLYQSKDRLSIKDLTLLKMLSEKSPEINLAAELTQEFRKMIENKNESGLKYWIEKVNEYGIKELKGFANCLLNDYEVVKNAIILPWSNGPVEGHINKLKTIKRQMYGRAGFNLLRKKIILGYG